MFALILGGSASGKSEYAEQLAVSCGGRRLYLATMRPFGEEAAKRIARHRVLRAGKGFESRDCYTDLPKVETSGFQTVLLECMSNLLANEMFREGAVWEELPERLAQEVMELAGRIPHLVVVSNDIFEDGVRYDRETEVYRDMLGKINIALAACAQQVTEVVCGRPIQWKPAI